jgi:hypothetical protein
MLAKKVIHEGWAKNRESILKDIIESTENTEKSVSKYPLVGDISLPDGGFYIIPCYDYDTFNSRSNISERAKLFEEKFDGSKTSALEVDNVIAGTLPYRLFDSTYTNQYKALVDLYSVKAEEKVEYEHEKIIKYGTRKEILSEEESELT